MKKLNFSIFLISLLFDQYLQAQCYNRYDGCIRSGEDINIYQTTAITDTGNGSPVLRIDTLSTMDMYYPLLRNENYKLRICKTDSDYYLRYCLENTQLDTTYVLGTLGDFSGEMYCETNRFLFLNCYDPLLFSFDKGQVKEILFHSTFAGNDDTSVFLIASWKFGWLKYKHSFKQNGKKYYGGTLVQVTYDTMRVITPQTSKKFTYDDERLCFYNTDYSVTTRHAGTEYIDCNYVNHYISDIFYNKTLIDSFMQDNYAVSCKSMHDTLIVYPGTLKNSYYKGTHLSSINESDSLARHPLLSDHSFFNTSFKNYIIVKKTLGSMDHRGLKMKDGKTFTLNDMPVSDKDNMYVIIMLFDKNTFAFIGYPGISFGKG